jgi:hypothetical protein
MNKKIVSLILATALLISIAAASEIFTAKAQVATSISIVATTSTGILATTSSTTIDNCAYSPIKLTATISGGSSPQASAIKWTSTSSTGSFSTATTTSTTSTVTYTDTSTSTVTVTITASYPGNSANEPSQNTVQVKIYNIDFNGDHVVNFLDVIAFVQAYIAYQTNHSNYNSAYDLAGDGAIDFNSVALFVGLYESYQGPV